ncbi:jg11030 [Pararge aegeria aegeria]|uniref:Jg11030 protein n=1 Tax=Pararge aegeria aegeria TaxID=348720 RepID=A0A8S4SD21_9NEOP|nr:jg11030 [Pararge aegeria aegeria]
MFSKVCGNPPIRTWPAWTMGGLSPKPVVCRGCVYGGYIDGDNGDVVDDDDNDGGGGLGVSRQREASQYPERPDRRGARDPREPGLPLRRRAAQQRPLQDHRAGEHLFCTPARTPCALVYWENPKWLS